MGYEHHANWIDGRPHAGCSGGSYTVPDPRNSSQTLGAWPRSTGEDVVLAIAQLAGGSAAAGASGAHAARRAQVLRAGLITAAMDGQVQGLAARDALCAASLGLSEGTYLQTDEFFGVEVQRALAAGLDDEPRAAHLTLLRCHWSELLSGMGAELGRRLVRGERVLLLSDPVFPRSADLFAEALFDLGLDASRLAVLHDDGQTALRAALAHGGWSEVVISGHRHEEALLRALPGADGAQWLFHSLSRGSFAIELEDDPVERAAHIVEEAFGWRTTLGGQLPGQVGLVTCPARHLSAFSAALLAELERRPVLGDPGRFLDADLDVWMRRALELGLDEGATLIHGAGSSASPCMRSNARLGPLVFTNVEPHMRLVALTRPAPLLLLMRRVG